MTGAAYGASPTRRNRSTKAEMAAFRSALYDLVEAGQPMTVRHAFYRAVATGLVDKTESEYGRVQRQLAQMRRDWWTLKRAHEKAHPMRSMSFGERMDAGIDPYAYSSTRERLGDRVMTAIPFDWIADNTRWTRKPVTYDSVEEALRNTAETYRRDLWSSADEYVEIWCESDSIAGVISEETYGYAVPLQVVRGMASISYLYGAAQVIAETGKPAHLYYFGDYDKAGHDIDHNVEKDIREFAPDADIYFERTAITAEQIDEHDLPTKPSAKHKDFPTTVELEAFPPDALRALVRDCIERHVDAGRLEMLETVEAAEREGLIAIAETAGGAGHA